MFYIFHGDDPHTAQSKLDELKGKLGDPDMLSLNTTQLEGKHLKSTTLQDHCNAVPFLAPKRLVIVQDYFKQKPDKSELDATLDYLPNMPDSARLFFIESAPLKQNHAAIKCANAAENGYQKRFDKPQGRALDQWIMAKSQALGGDIEPQAAMRLSSNVGADLHILERELEKLVLYKGVQTPPLPITDADVQTLSPYAAEVNIFDLVDALGNRNGKRAAALLHQTLLDGAEPFQIFSMFVRQFRLLIQVKELAESGHPQAEIAKQIKQHPFVVGKIQKQSQSFSMSQLEKIYQHLVNTDLEVKTGQNDLVTALNLLVFSLTQ